MAKKWKIERAWVWAGAAPSQDKQKYLASGGCYNGTPGLVDLEEALENGAEPIGYIPSSSAYGGYMLLRRAR